MKHYKRISAEEFDRVFHIVARVGVEVIVRTPDGFLLTRRAIPPRIGEWHIPGVGILFREPIKHAIQRTAEEELGIVVKVERFLGMAEYLHDGGRHTVTGIYLAWPVRGEPRCDYQSTAIREFKSVPKNCHPVQSKFMKAHLDEILRG